MKLRDLFENGILLDELDFTICERQKNIFNGHCDWVTVADNRLNIVDISKWLDREVEIILPKVDKSNCPYLRIKIR